MVFPFSYQNRIPNLLGRRVQKVCSSESRNLHKQKIIAQIKKNLRGKFFGGLEPFSKERFQNLSIAIYFTEQRQRLR